MTVTYFSSSTLSCANLLKSIKEDFFGIYHINVAEILSKYNLFCFFFLSQIRFYGRRVMVYYNKRRSILTRTRHRFQVRVYNLWRTVKWYRGIMAFRLRGRLTKIRTIRGRVYKYVARRWRILKRRIYGRRRNRLRRRRRRRRRRKLRRIRRRRRKRYRRRRNRLRRRKIKRRRRRRRRRQQRRRRRRRRRRRVRRRRRCRIRFRYGKRWRRVFRKGRMLRFRIRRRLARI